jgi:hypothetical protein
MLGRLPTVREGAAPQLDAPGWGASGPAVHPHGFGQHPRQTPEADELSGRFGAAASRGFGQAPR